MRVFRLFPLALMLALLGGCAVTPPFEYDQQADFGELDTFAWLAPEYDREDVSVSHPVLESPLLGQRVRRAAVDVLEGKGYRLVDENPDFYVTYHTAQNERERRSASYIQIGYGRYDPFFGTGVLLDMTPRSFQEGTLIVDIVDARTDQLIWRGWRDAYLTQHNFEQEQVNEAVSHILSAFPPGSTPE